MPAETGDQNKNKKKTTDMLLNCEFRVFASSVQLDWKIEMARGDIAAQNLAVATQFNIHCLIKFNSV